MSDKKPVSWRLVICVLYSLNFPAYKRENEKQQKSRLVSPNWRLSTVGYTTEQKIEHRLTDYQN